MLCTGGLSLLQPTCSCHQMGSPEHKRGTQGSSAASSTWSATLGTWQASAHSTPTSSVTACHRHGGYVPLWQEQRASHSCKLILPRRHIQNKIIGWQ